MFKKIFAHQALIPLQIKAIIYCLSKSQKLL